MTEIQPVLGHELRSYAPTGNEWTIRCECGWYDRAPTPVPSEPPDEVLQRRYRYHLEDVSEPRHEESETFEPRRPRGPMEIRCPACKGYGHIPPTPLDVGTSVCSTCGGSETVLAAPVPRRVALRLPENLDYLEVGLDGKVEIHLKS
jgi:hypothetical protein